MNICIITPQYPPISGGTGSTVYRVARNLTEADYNVHVIVPGSNSIENIITPSWEDGITVHRTYPALGEHFGSQLELSDIGNYIINLHEKIEFDLLHSMSLIPAGLVGNIVSKEISCPLVVSIQNRDIDHLHYNPVLSKPMTWILEQVSSVISPTSNLLDKVKHRANIRQISQVIPNGFDPNIFDQRALQELIQERHWRSQVFGETFLRYKSKGGPVVGTTSIIQPEKGFSICLTAFTKLQKIYPSACLLIVGDFINPEQKKMAEKQIRKLGLKRRVFFTGLVPYQQVLPWLKEMDIFVFPSLHYGTSNALIEAMGIGLPIIASDTGDIRQLIKDGEDGLLIQPRAIDLLGQMMNLIIEKKELRIQLGKSAKLKVERQFSSKQESGRYQDAYHNVLACSQINAPFLKSGSQSVG